MADHKYIRREGTKGNYKYIYEDDLKNVKNYYSAHNGPKQPTNNNHTFTLGADGTTVPVKNTPQKKEAKNPFAGVGKTISSGIASVSNKARRDIKNAGNKLVMGANGAVEKVKDSAKDTAKKEFNKAVEKAFDKAETEYTKKEKDGTFDKLNKARTSNKVITKLTGVMEGAVKNETGNLLKKNRPPKVEAAETRKSSVKSIESDKATVTGSDYLKKAADKGLTKGDDLYDQFAESGDFKIVGDKNKIKKLDNYFTRSITEASLVKKATTLRKDADDAHSKMDALNDEFDKKSSELESKGAPMSKLDLRVYAKDKRFKDMIRLQSDGETVTDEQIMAGLSEDPYVSVPTEMVKDFENLFEESYKTAEKEHAARRAEYMANIMDIQNEKNYQKEMKDIEEEDFEWYQNGKRITNDGELSTSHRVKEK